MGTKYVAIPNMDNLCEECICPVPEDATEFMEYERNRRPTDLLSSFEIMKSIYEILPETDYDEELGHIHRTRFLRQEKR